MTKDVTPSLNVYYKSTRIKQYHKGTGRCARRRRSTSYDFGVGKRLANLPRLREIGFAANRRLIEVERLSHDPITGSEALHTACAPVTRANGTRVAGLRFTDPRAQALLHILLIFGLHPAGFSSKDLRGLLAESPGRLPGTITASQATYDLRRLRAHGLIEKIPRTHRYHVTATGLTTAMFLARVHDRILQAAIATLRSATPAPLRQAGRAYQAAIDNLTRTAGIPVPA